MGDSPHVTGRAHGCEITVIPTATDYIKIVAQHDGETAETTSIPKNRWVGRSGLSEYAQKIADQLGIETSIAHKALNDARISAIEQWNWRTFTTEGAMTAPSFDHLKSLTEPDDQVGDYPSTENLRDILGLESNAAVERALYRVIDSPTGSGKSYHNSTQHWLRMPEVTGNQQVILLSPTKESRDQSAANSEEAGLDSYKILGRDEACPVAAGEYDDELTVDGQPASEWLSEMCNDKGFAFHDAKSLLLEKNDQGLDNPPCSHGDSKCPAQAQWDDVNDSLAEEPEYDVIHCTHKLAFVPTIRYKNNMLFDEQPTFAEIGPGDVTGGRGSSDGLDTDRIFDAIDAFLKDAEASIDTAEELISVAKREANEMGYEEVRDEFADLYEAFQHHPNSEWYCNHPDAHTAARAFTVLLWEAARQPADVNGRRSAKVSHHPLSLSRRTNEEIPNLHWISLVLNENNVITTLRIVPDMSDARSVVGFDAHPVEQLWWLNVGDAMKVNTLISDQERRLWRRYERRLCVIRMGNGAYSYTSDNRFDVTNHEVLINSLRDQYGEHVRTAVAPSAVEDHVERILTEAGVKNPETMHHGDVESRNDFKGERIGIQLGCIDPGDDYVLDLLAELGLEAEPERQEADCNACSGKGCNQCNDTGKQRAFGRGFIGPDADSAADLLASVRENQVAQAIGRYARDADDPDDWAAVFVRTTAVPDNLVDFDGPWIWNYKPKQRAVADYLSQYGEGTAKAIADWINDECEYIESCSKRHVRETLDRHIRYGNVEIHEGIGYNGADVFEWTATEACKWGTLQFEIEEVDHEAINSPSPEPASNVNPANAD